MSEMATHLQLMKILRGEIRSIIEVVDTSILPGTATGLHVWEKQIHSAIQPEFGHRDLKMASCERQPTVLTQITPEMCRLDCVRHGSSPELT